MAIDRTFNFGEATHITEGDVGEFFNRSSDDLEELGMPPTVFSAIADLLNGELDHVQLRHGIEKIMETV